MRLRHVSRKLQTLLSGDLVEAMERDDVKKLLQNYEKLTRLVALDRKVLQRNLAVLPTPSELRAEADLRVRAGTSALSNETRLVLKLASEAGSGNKTRVYICDIETIRNYISVKKLLANAPDARPATNVVMSVTCIPFDYWATGDFIVHCKRVSDGLPDTCIMAPSFVDLAGDRCYRDQDKLVRELLSAGSAYDVRLRGVEGRRRVLGAVKGSLGREHPTLVGQYVDSNDRMSYEDIHRAFGRAVLRLKEIGRPEVLVCDESSMPSWYTQKHAGGNSGVVPFASIWQQSGSGGDGAES